jgi:hypothetical protein
MPPDFTQRGLRTESGDHGRVDEGKSFVVTQVLTHFGPTNYGAMLS